VTDAADARRFPCASCGGDCEFDPKTGGLTCPYCGRHDAIPQSAEQVVEKSYEEYLKPRPGQMASLAPDALEVKCDSCGASITFKPPEVSTNCPFCGRHRVAQAKSPDPIVAPQAVLPFALTKEQARDSVRRWLASLWFAPNALKQMAQQHGLSGVYLPFWTFDAHTTSFYQGERGTYYYVDERYVENGETKVRQVRETRWDPASGQVTLWHDDVTVPATTSVPHNRLDALAPWDFVKLTPYDPAYLAGFAAQRYQVDLPGGFERAKAIMEVRIREEAVRDIGGDEQRVDSLTSSYAGVTFKHLLLPVYLGAYGFGAKIYQVLVNARTGDVQGDRPYSIWKILFAILLAAGAVFLVISVLMMLGALTEK
jgi:predicted RNA-binding Zn-ribbon protein involved in translation (DUF1610 family)